MYLFILYLSRSTPGTSTGSGGNTQKSGSQANEFSRLINNISSNSDIEIDEQTSSTSHSTTSKFKSITKNMVQRKLDGFKVLDKKTTEKFNEAVANFIVTDMMPYNVVEGEGFKKMISVLQPNYQLPGRKAFTETKIPQLFKKTLETAKHLLEEKQFVALTTDCWTSVAMEPFIAVTVHFISGITWELHHICLGCFKLDIDHNAENLQETLLNIIEQWNISVDEISGCTTDNGSNILKCMQLLSWNHISCFGHTLNIGVKRVFQTPKYKATITKARNIQNSLARSWKMKRNLKAIQQRLSLPQHSIPSVSETRWWSLLRLLKIVVEQHIALVTMFSEFNKHKYRSYSLSSEELNVLECIVRVLEPLEILCEHMCGETYVTSSALWPVYRKLKENIDVAEETENGQDNEDNDNSASEQEINKIIVGALDEHYMQPNTKKLLQIATFLDPRFKEEYIESCEEVVAFVKDEALAVKLDNDTTDKRIPDSINVNERKGLAAILKPSASRKCANSKSTAEMVEDEIEGYKRRAPIDLNDSPLVWWKSHSAALPRLATLAKKYLCLTGTSVPSERVFSCAGNIVTDTRSCLSPEHTNELVFLAMNKHLLQ